MTDLVGDGGDHYEDTINPTDATPEPEPAAPAPEDDVSEAALLKARLEESEAKSQFLEKKVGKAAGRAGYYMKRLRDLGEDVPEPDTDAYAMEPPPAAEPEPVYDDLPPEPEPEPSHETHRWGTEAPERSEPEREHRQPEPSGPARRDSVTAYTVAQAVAGAGQAFAQRHPDFTDHAAAMKDYLARSGSAEELARIVESDDPIEAAQETTRVFENAYRAVHVYGATSRKADQVRNLDEMKRRAISSGFGGPGVPVPRPRSLEDMTADEAEKLLDQLIRK